MEKGQPLKLTVVAQHGKDGIIFELPSGENSWLAFPQSTWIDATFTPNKVSMSDRYGPLLTYTRDDGVAESIVKILLDNDAENFMRDYTKDTPLVPGTFFVVSGGETWEVDYNGKVVKEFVGNHRNAHDLHDISGFDVDDYFDRHGSYPLPRYEVNLRDIAYYGPSGKNQRYPAESATEKEFFDRAAEGFRRQRPQPD